MKTCERFERCLDQLRMGDRQSRKARQSPELLPINNLRPLERRFDYLPRTAMRQRSDDSVSNSPATLKVPLSPVTNDNTDQDVIIKSPRHFQDFDSALYEAQFG